MGRSDYLVQAGVGFDVDRSGARKSIGIFESLASTLNSVATKTAAKKPAAKKPAAKKAAPKAKAAAKKPAAKKTTKKADDSAKKK